MSQHVRNTATICWKGCWNSLHRKRRWSKLPLSTRESTVLYLHCWDTECKSIPAWSWIRDWRTHWDWPTSFFKRPQCPMCGMLCFNKRNCCDDSCTNYLPIILDPGVLWLSHGRSTLSSSLNIWMCGPVSTVSTRQCCKHRGSPVLPCWSEVQCRNSLLTVQYTERSNMRSVHKVTYDLNWSA